MDQPKVSIIVPVYNAASTLSQCVRSVIQQSYTDFELLLIDDGSTDSSASICDEFARQDSRIRVFYQCNKGVSSARNCGLQHAIAKWVAFVDSDDWLELDFLANLIVYNDYPFIVGGFKRFGDVIDESKPDYSRSINIVDELHVLWGLTLDKFIFWYVWGKLFRLDIIKSQEICFYEDMKYNEDNCFVLEYLSCIDYFMFVSVSDYMHLFENGRSQKYSMKFDVFKTHVCQQEQSFVRLENKTGYRYDLVRQNVHRRFFDNFIYYLLKTPNYTSYNSEINGFKEFDTKGTFLDEVSISLNRRLLRFLLFRIPCWLGYAFRHLLFRIAY